MDDLLPRDTPAIAAAGGYLSRTSTIVSGPAIWKETHLQIQGLDTMYHTNSGHSHAIHQD